MSASSSDCSIVPAGLHGLATISPSGRGSSASSIATVGWKRVSGRGLDHHRRHAERGQDVEIGRVERRGHRHAVAGIERREEGERERARGADGDRDALDGQRRAVPVPAMRRDALAQAAPAERLGVAHRLAGPQCGDGGGDRAGRGAGAGLADLHADHVRLMRRARLRLARIGRGDHVHHHERRRGGGAADL